MDMAFAVAMKLCNAVVADIRSNTETVTLVITMLDGFGLDGMPTGSRNPYLRSFMGLLKGIFSMTAKEQDKLSLHAVIHNTKLSPLQGMQWWRPEEYCAQEAVVITDHSLPIHKQLQVYCCLGGVSLSDASNRRIQGIVVHCKTWIALASSVTAVTLLTAACPGPTVQLQRFLITRDVQACDCSLFELYEESVDGYHLHKPMGKEGGGADVEDDLLKFCDAFRRDICSRLPFPIERLNLGESSKTEEQAFENLQVLAPVLAGLLPMTG